LDFPNRSPMGPTLYPSESCRDMQLIRSMPLFSVFYPFLSPCSRRDTASQLVPFPFKKWGPDRYPIGVTTCENKIVSSKIVYIIYYGDTKPKQTTFCVQRVESAERAMGSILLRDRIIVTGGVRVLK
jgi:hypothetical protein